MMKARSQSGYSLAEALVVMAIVGMLAVVTVPAFMSMLRSNRVRSSVRNFETAVRFSRQRAVTRRTQTRLTFDPAARPGAYSIYDLKTKDDGTTSWVIVLPQTRLLDQGVYFANDATSPVPDLFDTSGSTIAATDAKPDIVFNSDGTIAASSMWVKTDFTSMAFNLYKIEFLSAGTFKLTASHS